MSPPELARDAPILDVFHPVEIYPGEVFGYDADATVVNCFERCFGKRFGAYEPLCGDHRFNHLTTALRARYSEQVRFFLDDQTGAAHVLPDIMACFVAILPGIRSAICVDARALI